jgi:uncharacterized protein (DUF362 family)
MPKKLTRRQFLLSLAAGISAATVDQLLAACGQTATSFPPSTASVPTATSAHSPTAKEPTAPVEEQLSRPPTSSPTESPTENRTIPQPTQAGIPDLVVVRNGEPDELVRRALSALGGMEKFVPRGANVIIKPNICVAYHTYEYAATTNPWVVGTLVRLCLEAGARSVKVMDFPFGGSVQEAYAISGIEEQVKAAGGEMADMPGFKYVETEIPDGKDLHKTFIFDDILKTDVLINVPIAKHHNLARLTLGMKNLMGVIRDRSAMHRNLAERLPDLASRIRPALTIVDAVRILMDNGPTGGNLADVKKLDTIIASTDIVAADSYATTLFGLQPKEIPYVKAASKRGLGRSDLKSLRIEEISIH